jgi:hypothetical protein
MEVYRRTRVPGLIDPIATSTRSILSLTGLLAWYKADVLALSDNDGVTTWTDSSTNLNDATYTGGIPTFKTAVINSLPVVFFDLTDDGMTTPCSRATGTAMTIVVVYNMPSTASGGHRVIQGSNNWLIGPYDNYHQMFNGDFIQGPVLSTDWIYAVLTIDVSGNSDFRVNGSSQGTRTGTGPGTVYLGGAGAYGEMAGCNVAEIIIFDEVKNSSDISFIESYLASKYGF